MQVEVPWAWTTGVGALWTLLVVALLVRGKDGPLAWRWTWLGAGLLLLCALALVTRAIAGVEALAGGLRVLDARYPYGVADVRAFAEALGPRGRVAYAAFQLGYDTWAPPAFAGFVGSVACVALPRAWARRALVLVGAYLLAVVLANALMPVVMLNYPALETPVLRALLHVTPWLDFAKYTLHLLAWLTILCGAVASALHRK